MARPKTVVTPPRWFDVAHYEPTASMDAADWYLNLKLRFRLARKALDASIEEHVNSRFIRNQQPVVRRTHDVAWEFFGTDIGSDLRAILNGKQLRLGVYPLQVEEFYVFEKKFPEEVRAFARTFVPGKAVHPKLIPAGFEGPVDHLFVRRMTNVFARIDLSLPDKVLQQHFLEFVARKRKEFAEIGGRQPYQEALDVLGTKRAARLKTFAKLRLLPYMDLKSWAEESNQKVPAGAWADLLMLQSEDDVREARKYAELLLRPFVIDGWLIEQARAALKKAEA